MSYGPYSTAVQEVVDFVFSGEILTQPYRSETDIGCPVHVVHSLEHVERFRDGGYPESELDENATWSDMKMGDVEAMEDLACPERAVAWYETVVPELQRATNHIFDYLSQSDLPGRLPGFSVDEIEEMTSHFSAIMAVRSMHGSNCSSLSEILFRAHKAFGYPCGWSGSHSSGSLVVFSLKTQCGVIPSDLE